MENTQIFEMADRLKTLQEQKKDLEAQTKALAAEWVAKFWNEPMRTGNRRYYDNCLYLFSFLALSGNYRVY